MKPIALWSILAVLVLGAAGGCAAFIKYDRAKPEHNTYSGCLPGTDVYVTLDYGVIRAAQSDVCQTGQSTYPELRGDLPEDVTLTCLKEIDGLGLGVAKVSWRDSDVLVSTATCEPR